MNKGKWDFAVYLKFHHISTSWGTHQTCPHILGFLVQRSDISWVLVMVHHLYQ